MTEKHPLDDLVDDLVVFKHEDPNHPDGHYFSNNPLWNDSRIRDHWTNRHSDEARAAHADQSSEGDDEEEEDTPDYEQWTNEQLRTELAARSLSVEGKKVDLVARLKEDDEADEVEE